jgi:hypothetical protein
MKFSTKIFLPILKREVRFSSINNQNYFDIIRFIINDDNEGLNDYFEWLITDIVIDKNIIQDLSNIEKFLILLDNRSLTIGNILNLNNSKNIKIDISILNIKKNIIDKLKVLDLTKRCKINDIDLELSLPKSMIINNLDDLYKEIIDKIVVDDKIIKFNFLTNFDKDDIINNIPLNSSNDIFNYIKNSQNLLSNFNIISKNDKIGLDNVQLNLFDSSLFFFLKSIFKDDLLNFYELEYNMVSKMNFTIDNFMKLTPNECKLFIKFYNTEKKKEQDSNNEASRNNVSSMNKYKP